jgi:hypothetical protein
MPKSKIIQLPSAMTPAQRALAPKAQDILDMPFDEVVRCRSDHGAANGSRDDPIVLQGNALTVAQAWVERYGFDRLPATYGELMGMHDYCMELEVLSGFDSVAPELRPSWQASALRVQAQYSPHKLEPLRLYIDQDLAGLRRYHTEQGTLSKLGKAYDEFAEDAACTSE